MSLYCFLINLSNSALFKHSPLCSYFSVRRDNEFLSMLVCYLGNRGNCQKGDKIYLLSYWKFVFFLNTSVHIFISFCITWMLECSCCNCFFVLLVGDSQGVGKCFYFSLKQEKSAKDIQVCRSLPHCGKYKGVKLLYPHL